jgi:uncharacterized protein (TIGR02145 family)
MIENSTLGTSSAQYYATYEDRAIGYYYTWDQAQAGDVCPSGYSLPNVDQWTRLRDFINSSNAAPAEKAKWVGTVSLAGDYAGAWYNWGTFGHWWSSSVAGQNFGGQASTSVVSGPNSNPTSWFTVRCIKN